MCQFFVSSFVARLDRKTAGSVSTIDSKDASALSCSMNSTAGSMDKSNVSPYDLVLSNLLSMLLFVPELPHSAALDTVSFSWSVLEIASFLVPIGRSPVSAMTREDSIVNDHRESNRTSMRNRFLSYLAFSLFSSSFRLPRKFRFSFGISSLRDSFRGSFRTGHIVAELTSFE